MVLVHGHVDGHIDNGLHGGVAEHLAVDDGLDLFELFVGDLREVREVEAQASGIVQRAGLLDVRAQDLAERGVQQMRAGVVALDGVAAHAVDDGVDVVAEGKILLEDGFVRAHALHGQDAAGDFGDGEVAVGRGEAAGVADLSAGVAIEAGLVEHHIDGIAGFGCRNADAVFHDGEDFGIVERRTARSRESRSWADRGRLGWRSWLRRLSRRRGRGTCSSARAASKPS